MDGHSVHVSFGLHERCDFNKNTCEPFPKDKECDGDDRYFCSIWRSVGFLMSFAVAVQGITLIAFLVLLNGGKQRREGGWFIVVGLVALGAAVQIAGVSLVTHLHDHDSFFSLPDFHLDSSFTLCTISWTLMLLIGIGIGVSKYLLEPEGGYELIPDEP